MGRRPGRPPYDTAPDDAGFGGEEVTKEIPRPTLPPAEGDEIPTFEVAPTRRSEEPEPPDPEIIALGPPPADAAGIQRWNYQLLSLMAYKSMINPKLTEDQRIMRASKLTQAAARHYPEAAKKDLADQIAREREEIAGRKRAKAAAKVQAAPPAGGAKVIPIRREA